MKVAAIVLAIAASGLAQAQSAPPRTILDVKALLEQTSRSGAALARAKEILAAPAPQGGPAELTRHHLERANAAAELGLVQERLAAVRQAGAIAPAQMQRRVLNEWASAESSAGNILEELRLRELAHERYPEDRGNRLSDKGVLARVYATLGDLAASRRMVKESEELYVRLERRADPVWRESFLLLLEHQRAALHLREGRYAESEAAYRKALAAMERDLELNKQRQARNIDTASQAVLENHRLGIELELASAMLRQGKLVEAELMVRQALRHALAFAGRNSAQAARALSAFAAVLVEQNRFAEGETLSRESIRAYLDAGVPASSAQLGGARARLGANLSLQGKWTQALAVFDERFAGLRQDAAALERFGADDLDWAIALLFGGRTGEAEEMLARMHRWTSERYGAGHPDTARRLAFHALSIAGKDAPRARAELAAALPVLLEEARALGLDEGVVRTRRLRWIIEGTLRLLGEARTPEAAAEAFRLADIARGSGVQRAVAASAARAAIRDPQLADLARAEQDAGNRIAALSEIVTGILARPPEQQLPKVVADMRRDIDTLRTQREALRKRIQSGFREYADLVEPPPLSVQDVQHLLRPEEALVSVYLAPDRAYVWAIPANGPAAFHVAPLEAAEVAGRVARLRKALDIGEVGIEQFPHYDARLARELYEALLAPVAEGWGKAASLLVVPHGALGQLPFALLVTGEPDGAGRGLLFGEYRGVPWLLRKAAVTQLPSVNALSALRKLAPAARERLPFAGFGDPLFSAGAGTAPTRAAKLRNLHLARTDSAGQSNAFLGIADLARLPDTAEEIQEIAKLLGAEAGRDVFLGARATETNVKTQNLVRRRVIAFATHGLVPGDLNGLNQPALALSNPKVTGEPDADGLLRMDEILSLKLDADWIVLSACNTAAADGEALEAVSGLGRAFFYAGARALLVSNWPVETVSAKLLTTELFRRQAADPALTRAQALRDTMLGMLDEGAAVDPGGKPRYAYAHPMFWAPFALIGDGGR